MSFVITRKEYKGQFLMIFFMSSINETDDVEERRERSRNFSHGQLYLAIIYAKGWAIKPLFGSRDLPSSY